MNTNKRFFLESQYIHHDKFKIVDEQVKHIRQVLRMHPGDPIELVDGEGGLYSGSIKQITKSFVSGTIQGKESFTQQKPLIILAQSIGKQGKFEQVVTQATELGVHSIIPLETEYTVRKVKNIKKQTERWERIIVSSVKQSRSLFIPELREPITFEDFKEKFPSYDVTLMLHTSKGKHISTIAEKIRGVDTILLLIGPEGGFSPKEVESLGEDQLITLQGNILRTETAAIVTLSIINLFLDKI